MSGMVQIVPMVAEDAMLIERQRSQRVALGLEAEMSIEIAQDLIDGGEAWTVWRLTEIEAAPIACMGIRETFPGVQGVGWAILAEGIGAAHLAVTRHFARRVAESPLQRIEVVAKSSVDAEAILAKFPDIDPNALLQCVLALDDGPEVRWPRLAGMMPAHVLRKFGAASETHILFERIR